MKAQDISLIIPTYNEAAVIQQALEKLVRLGPWLKEIILVDGGSTDATSDLIREWLPESSQIRLIQGPKGRAAQMQAGAKQAQSCQLLFCHIDTHITPAHLQAIPSGQSLWGCYDVRLDDIRWVYRVIAFFINWRSKLSGISTGDQCLLVNTDLFWLVDGFSDIPLMEDVEICRQLKKHQKPMRLKPFVVTSSRRWQQNGVFKTVFLMWRLRFAYWRGVPADQLAKIYYPNH